MSSSKPSPLSVQISIVNKSYCLHMFTFKKFASCYQIHPFFEQPSFQSNFPATFLYTKNKNARKLDKIYLNFIKKHKNKSLNNFLKINRYTKQLN